MAQVQSVRAEKTRLVRYLLYLYCVREGFGNDFQSLSLGQMDRQVVASGRQLNLRRDLHRVAKRLARFFASTHNSPFNADYPLFYWLIIG